MRTASVKATILTALGALFVAVFTVSAWAQSGPSIRGTIIDDQTQGYLPAAEVILRGTPYRARSESNGSYRLDGVPAGSYELVVSYVGFDDFAQTVEVTAGGTVDLNIALGRRHRVADEIVVQGARFGDSKALNEQKEAANIKNIISEEQIQSFPDLNTAEVLQRVSGISIQRDNGEGRFVAMRGTPSSYTNITVNGQQVAFSNGENRSVELDVVSAAQLAGIEVTKVITPDMDADAVGGSINLKTRSAFDQEERVLNTTLGMGTNSISDDTNTRLEFNYSDVFGARDNLGLSIGFNYARTSAERHNNEQRWGGEEDVNGVEIPFALRNSEVQFSENTRDRYGLNTRFELRLNDNHELYASAVYNFREDDQNRQITRVRWDRGDYQTATSVTGARVIKSLNDRLEEQEISTYSIGGEHRFGASVLDFSLSTSSASTEKPEGQLRPEWEVRGVDVDVTNLNGNAPGWDSMGFDINGGSIYPLDVVDLKYEDTSSDIDSASVDFTMPMVWGGDTGTFKIGAKLRALDKERADRRTQWRWEGADDVLIGQFYASDVSILESGYDLGPVVDRDAFRSFFFNNQAPGSFEPEVRNDVDLGEPYNAEEDVSSVYLMTTQEYGNLLVLGGVRAEFTDLDYSAANLVLDDETVVSNVTERVSRSYDYVFPNLQLRYRLTPDTNLRLAYSKSMARPDFWDSMPYSSVQLDGEEIVSGNPFLDPAIADNVDILAEHFFEGIGLLSGGVFFKQIDDFNFRTTNTQVGGPYDGFEVETSVNGGSADLFGIEVSWQQQFTRLPGFWSGFGIYANYTYTNASSIDLGADTTRTDIETLPEQLENVGNFAITYEKDAIISRLSLNYSGKWIEEVGDNADEDLWRDAATTVDFSFTYMFDNGIDVFLQGNNLTDEVKYVYFGVPSRSRQYSITGRTFNLGAKWSF
ncbi:MAG: TonB-dependent receptor [Pseudomonadota bacterium]